MKGSISKRGPSWLIKVYLGVSDDGKTKFLTRSVRGTRSQAEEVLAEMLVEGGRLKARYGGAAPDLDALAGWLPVWLASRRRRISEHSRVTYERAIRLHIVPKIGNLRLRQVTATRLTSFYASLDLAPATVRMIHAVLRQALAAAQRDGLIADNPAQWAELPPTRRVETRVPSHDEIARVLDANEGRWEATAILVMVSTGLRRGECCGLFWGDLDLDEGILRVERNIQVIHGELTVLPPKSAAGNRRIVLGSLVAEHLRAYRASRSVRSIDQSRDPVFPARHGGLQKTSSFGSAIVAAGERAGVRLSSHMLRHRFGTDSLLGGIQPRVTQARLGHSSMRLQEIYAHVIEDAQEGAAGVADDVVRKITRKPLG